MNNTKEHTMNKKKMYVWRIESSRAGGMYTQASMEMRPLDLARYNKIQAEGDETAMVPFVEHLRRTCLTTHSGDIAVSPFETYEVCMEHLRQQGDIKFDHVETPTQH